MPKKNQYTKPVVSVSKRCREPIAFCNVAAVIEYGILFGEKPKLV